MSVLAGVTVVEYAQYVAGPLCGLLLADMGATVIKVEPPGGDAYRHLDPVAEGLSRYFIALNRGKRSVVVDLKTSEGLRSSSALLDMADIVIHNCPPERARSFRLDWGSLQRVQPQIVSVAINSFGHEGPLAGKPAYDLLAQGYSGLLMADARPGDKVPMRAGAIPMSDLTAGFLASTGALGALHKARATGVGEQVDVSLLASAMAVQIQDLVNLGSRTPNSSHAVPATRADIETQGRRLMEDQEINPYYRCYEAADGFLALACLNLTQRLAFLRIMDVSDPCVANPDEQPRGDEERERRERLTQQLESRFGERTVARWIAAFEEAGVPCGLVRTREGLDADPQVRATNLLRRTEYPGLGEVGHLGPLLNFGSSSDAEIAPAPALGEANDELLPSPVAAVRGRA